MAENPLVTPSSLSLSLSAPRVPPFGTVQRDLLLGRKNALIPTRKCKSPDANNTEITLLHKSLVKKLRKCQPHLTPAPPDPFLRWLVTQIPTKLRHQIRDGGSSRFFIDLLTILVTAPPLAAVYPSALHKFIRLSSSSVTVGRTVTQVGPHWRQHYELYKPEPSSKRLIFFVHGGAWGSGFAWMYRLVVVPFLEQEGWSVALPNYRTYPDGDVLDHVLDLELAASSLKKEHDFDKVLLVGHSSAAHTAMLMLVERLVQGPPFTPTLEFDAFLGLSGPYNIFDHFAYESSRGVEEYSPMKPACGTTPENFRRTSPCLRLFDNMASEAQKGDKHKNPSWSAPPITLLHGFDDTTVPFTATSDAARFLRSMGVDPVEEVYLPGVGHQDVPIQFMLGGVCRDFFVEWVRRQTQDTPRSPSAKRTQFYVKSKL